MPTFEYKATTVEGKVLTGQRESHDKDAVIIWLQDSGYIPIYAEEISEASKTSSTSLGLFNSRQLSHNQILEITEQLSTLVRSKLPLDHALKILQQIART